MKKYPSLNLERNFGWSRSGHRTPIAAPKSKLRLYQQIKKAVRAAHRRGTKVAGPG
jgi:hypothetical protein